MSWVTEETYEHSLPVYAENGQTITLHTTGRKTKRFYDIRYINGRISMDTLKEAQAAICLSAKDITIFWDIVQLFDYTNKLIIPSMPKLAESLGFSRLSVERLIKRACEAELFYKGPDKSYFMNPFIIMSPKLSSAGHQMQESAQQEWNRTTGLYHISELDMLVQLNRYLMRTLSIHTPLPVTEFTIQVARYFDKHKSITDKQHQALLKFI